MPASADQTRVPHVARRERAALADLLAQVGPDVPTLCEGWTSRDLAAHLVVRDRRPDAALGVLLPPLGAWTERVRGRQASAPWSELVDRVRQGPPPWSLLSGERLDRAANSVEMYVHHEDVRRGLPGWEPRNLDDGVEERLWGALRGQARFGYRRSPVGVLLRAVLLDGRGLGEVEARGGGPRVVLEGPPSELVLHATGRQRAARVRAHGDPEAVRRLAAVRLGL